MTRGLALNEIRNERGILTVEFVFGIFVAFGILTLLLRLTYTFAVVEVTQYIMFSTSRAYSAAHTSADKQYEMALAKYQELAIEHPDFSTIYGRGWYTIPEQPVVGHFSQNAKIRPATPDYGEDTSSLGGVAPFVGARIDFQAPVLSGNVPFIGTTDDDDQPFTAGIASFLIREPSLTECQDFMKQRIEGIRNFGQFSNLVYMDVNAYVPVEDNGC